MCASMRVCVWVLVYLCVCACVGEYSACKITTNCHLILSRNFETDLNEAQKVKLMIYDKKKLFSSLYIWNQKKRERIQLRWKDFICFDRMGRKMILNFVSSILMSWCIWHQNQQKEEKEDEEPSPLVLLRRRFLGLLVEGLQCGLVAAKISEKSQTNPSFGPKSLCYFWGYFWCFYFVIVKHFTFDYVAE